MPFGVGPRMVRSKKHPGIGLVRPSRTCRPAHACAVLQTNQSPCHSSCSSNSSRSACTNAPLDDDASPCEHQFALDCCDFVPTGVTLCAPCSSPHDLHTRQIFQPRAYELFSSLILPGQTTSSSTTTQRLHENGIHDSLMILVLASFSTRSTRSCRRCCANKLLAATRHPIFRI
jgi:hypothetical protein